MPSGRDVVQLQPARLPSLGPEIVAQLRAPLDQEELSRLKSEIAGDSDNEDGAEIPGSFPDADQGQSSSYY